jgi:prepilin-type N-terminal cleavage/methylation domain-containing protein
VNYKKPNNGFTIVELLIVIVVIAILAAITIVSYNGIINKTRLAVIENDLSSGSSQLEQYRISTSEDDKYPSDLTTANLKASGGTIFQYTYNASLNTYCLSASGRGLEYSITSGNKVPTIGSCLGGPSAPVVAGGSTNFDGYAPVQPDTCPTNGGSWIKVPGNTLYNKPTGFCVQQYPAVNVGGVATSQNTGNKWTAITQPAAITAAAAVDTNTHLFTEDEWMTIATNAAAQPANWSGGAIGNGTLSTGSSTATHGGTSFILSNGQVIYFDVGNGSYYASREWTCYTGTAASNCGIAGKDQPVPSNAYHTDQFATFTSFGALKTNTSGYYYGDPRYSNSALGAYVNSSRNKGLGYLWSLYAANSNTIYTFSRGYWTGATSGGLYTMYMNTITSYSHAQYGFRAAR